jgi:hypothetical protein
MIDGKDLRAELPQLLRAQVRDDDADQEGDQRNDRNRLDARFIYMSRDRCGAQMSRPQ